MANHQIFFVKESEKSKTKANENAKTKQKQKQSKTKTNNKAKTQRNNRQKNKKAKKQFKTEQDNTYIDFSRTAMLAGTKHIRKDARQQCKSSAICFVCALFFLFSFFLVPLLHL